MIQASIAPPFFVHPQAYVAPEVTIGERTKVWQLSSITGDTRLGRDCVVWPLVNLNGAHFGDRCKIASGVVMSAGFLVGDDCFIGPNVVFCNDMWPEVGGEGLDDHALRNGYCVIVGNDVAIGANATILPGVMIGQECVIAAGAVVDRDVRPGCLFTRQGVATFMPTIEARRRARTRIVFRKRTDEAMA